MKEGRTTSRSPDRLARVPSTPSDVGAAIEQHATTDDAASLTGIDRPPSKEEPNLYSPYAPAVLALLMPASLFGVLARLGVQALADFDGMSIFPLAWVQALGCLFMGIALRLKEPIGSFYGPLYTAFTTGFCGSLTTFSGWQLDVFDSWINAGHFRHDWLRNVIDGCTKLFFTLSISLASLSFGVHLGSKLAPFTPSISPPRPLARYTLTVISILAYAASFVTYFKLSISFRHQATAALLFSYPGTLTRYLLSIRLNPLVKTLPLGTMIANSFGTALLATVHVLQGLPHPISSNSCNVLQGIADGYCGCLTTVSTFAAELSALSDKKRWLYASLSIVVAQLLILVIMGPSFWAGGVNDRLGGTCRHQ